MHSLRLREVSHLLENPREERKQLSKNESAGAGRRAKREPALLSYSDFEARHSGDGVILLVNDDAHLSATFISDIFLFLK